MIKTSLGRLSSILTRRAPSFKTHLSEIQSIQKTRQICSSRIARSCWNCNSDGDRKNEFFCGKCGSLLDVAKDVDFFKLLAIENKFSVNSKEVTKKFRQLQTLVHPDKFSNKPDREQKNSLDWSSLINKAYKTISTPLPRGHYILKLEGLEMPQDNSSMDKEFLMEMMERNEEVEDAESKAELSGLLGNVQNDIDDEFKKLQTSFDKKDFNSAKEVLVRIKYFSSLENSIKEKVEKITSN